MKIALILSLWPSVCGTADCAMCVCVYAVQCRHGWRCDARACRPNLDLHIYIYKKIVQF